MDWVSFDEIKKTVSLQMVLDHYGIDLPRFFQPVITEDFRIAANSFGVR